MLSTGANFTMVFSGGNVTIWCYHVMLSSGMKTHPFFIFPENFTYSPASSKSKKVCQVANLICSGLLYPFAWAAQPSEDKGVFLRAEKPSEDIIQC
jgi:hypothetical protein